MKVKQLYRYPVKSLLGEKVSSFTLDTRGVVNDRLFAITDENKYIGSHKNTRRFRKLPRLFELKSFINNNEIRISFPNDDQYSVDNPILNRKLSDFIGQPVSIAKEDKVSHLDDGPIHILTTASLNWLQGLLPNIEITPERFRPNILLDGPSENKQLTEDLWIGKVLNIGNCKLEITNKTQRCLMVTSAQNSLAYSPEILKTLGKHNDACFGVYAKVITQGTIEENTTVTIED
jgi:uncharacterized protein YcbX